MAGGGAPLAAIADRAGDLCKIARLAEVLVDAREANVGDMVDGLEAVHDRFPDLARRDLIPSSFQLSLDRRDQAVDALRGNVAFAAGNGDGSLELAAVERLALAILLHHRQVAQLHPFERCEARSAVLALAPATDRRAVFRRAAVLHLTGFVRAEGAAHGRLRVLVDRESRANIANPAVHLPLDFAIVLKTFRCQSVEDVGDHVGDFAELRLAEPAGRPCRRTDADAAGFHRWKRVERHAVLVAGDTRALEALVRIFSGKPQGTKIDQRQMGVGPARDEVRSALLQAV